MAGTSLKTVSRVINDEGSVSPDAIARVRAAANTLNYRPNMTAGSLRRRDRRTRTIALMLENVANPFSAAIHRVISDVAHERSVDVMAASVEESEDREKELVLSFAARGVDGIIAVPTGGDQSHFQVERDAGISLVFLDRHPRGIAGDVVLSTNVRGSKEAVGHLITHGHKRIAFLGDAEWIATAADRNAGYRAALAAAGISVDESLVKFGCIDTESALSAATELLALADPPTAIFASHVFSTLGAAQALHRANLHHDVALVGFDDIATAEIVSPGLTLVSQDITTLGRRAADRLFARIDGDAAPYAIEEIPTRLIVRGSGEIRPRR